MKKALGLKFNNGQGLVEYVLLLTLLVIGVILVMSLAGVSISDLYCSAANAVGGGKACDEQQTYCYGGLDQWQTAGNLSQNNGQVCFQNGLQSMNKCSMNLPESDYVINMNDVTLSKGDGYGVYFRTTVDANGIDGYAFQYDPGAGNALLIRRWINGKEVMTPIARVPINSTIYNVPHDFKIVVEGNTFTVFMDGVQVMTAQDSTYPTGGIGLRSWDSTSGCFNDFSLDQLP